MGQEIYRDVDEMEHEPPMRRAEAHVNKIVRRLVYSLPSGRKMTVILDDEGELKPGAMAWLHRIDQIGYQSHVPEKCTDSRADFSYR
jgi:hypothetical protein